MLRIILGLSLIVLLVAACSSGDKAVAYDPKPTTEPKVQPTSASALVGDAARGEEIFQHGKNDAPACGNCHSIATGPRANGFSLGPNLSGVAERAVGRDEDLSAEQYLRQSIVDPSAYLAPGFSNLMYPDFGKKFSEQDIEDLIAYLKTL